MFYFVGLTNADNNKSSHAVENSQVPHTKDNMVQEKCHQAAESNAGQSKECQKDYNDEGKQQMIRSKCNKWTQTTKTKGQTVPEKEVRM